MNKTHLRIGSSPNNQLVIEEIGIDAHHLELFSDEFGNVFITDLDSKNGTFINDTPLKGFKLLQVGDKLRLGDNYYFDWENLVQKYSKQVFSTQKEQTVTPKNQQIHSLNEAKDIRPESINNQLIIIYSSIFILLLLLFYIL